MLRNRRVSFVHNTGPQPYFTLTLQRNSFDHLLERTTLPMALMTLAGCHSFTYLLPCGLCLCPHNFAGHVTRAFEDVTGEMVTEVLPALNLLCWEDPPRSSVSEFCTARRLSGCPVASSEPKGNSAKDSSCTRANRRKSCTNRVVYACKHKDLFYTTHVTIHAFVKNVILDLSCLAHLRWSAHCRCCSLPAR